MGFFGFGKKKESKEESLPPPNPAPEQSSLRGAPPSVDPAALLGKETATELKQEVDTGDFPFEHISSLPIELDNKPNMVTPALQPLPEPTPKADSPPPETPSPDIFFDEAPMPEQAQTMDLNELAKQLPIQDIPKPPSDEKTAPQMDFELEIPDDFIKPEVYSNPEPVPEQLPEFTMSDFEEVAQVEDQNEIRKPIDESGRHQEPAEMGAYLLGEEKPSRRFKITKINGELFVEAESYKFFLENMVTMHDDLKRTNDIFLKYSDENSEEDRLYARMFQELNSIHDDLIKIDHKLFEREEW